MTLHSKILDAARDEVRTDKNNRYKAAFGQEAPQEGLDTALVIERFAALLAMEKQAEFFRWSAMSYYRNDKGEWKKPNSLAKGFTELELYNIWREATTQQ